MILIIKLMKVQKKANNYYMIKSKIQAREKNWDKNYKNQKH